MLNIVKQIKRGEIVLESYDMRIFFSLISIDEEHDKRYELMIDEAEDSRSEYSFKTILECSTDLNYLLELYEAFWTKLEDGEYVEAVIQRQIFIV